MPDLINLSATQLIDLQKNNKVSAQEIAESFINRYEKVEKKVQAWEFFDKELFLQKSIEADDYRKSGKDLGALHGLPIGIKDIFGTDDMPTRCGTDIRKGLQTTKESEVASLLTNAGSIIMGKTVTTEFAYFDPGKTKNPHDYERTPGGSSSGSAAAVAAGMVPVAIGSQTNGSVIRPASYCGVYGYKPTFGSISRRGVLKQSYLLDHVGIISKCIDDLALISKEIIKKDIDDISTVHFPVTNILNISKEEPPFEPKFIFYKTSKWKNMDKDAIKSFEQFIKKMGKYIEVYDTPSYFDKIFDYHQIIHETDMSYAFKDYYQKSKSKLGKKLIEAIERGMKYKSRDYVEACENRDYFYKTFSEVFHDYHAILTPSTTGVAPKGLNYTGSPEFCTIWTYLGMPSISLPLLTGSNNLPLGVQIVGEKFDDPRLMRTANWLVKKYFGGEKK